MTVTVAGDSTQQRLIVDDAGDATGTLRVGAEDLEEEGEILEEVTATKSDGIHGVILGFSKSPIRPPRLWPASTRRSYDIYPGVRASRKASGVSGLPSLPMSHPLHKGRLQSSPVNRQRRLTRLYAVRCSNFEIISCEISSAAPCLNEKS